MLEEEKVALLKRELIEYATLVEAMIDKSIKGLTNKDRDVLLEVIEKDEPKSNNFEIKLDELCTVVIAQYQPKGKGLRTVLMILKINNDLERMADHAANIAETALTLIEVPPLTECVKYVLKMAEITRSMLKDSIDSFVHEDSALAQDVCRRDDVVDELRRVNRREIIGSMCASCSIMEAGLDILR
ncbi:MAG TPA: PhoU domain-containing protein, partial [Thermodesulfobacteriota bacterium]|nr:PhoU domain-containing protein [Thermodesulfobacteriota bacterium]